MYKFDFKSPYSRINKNYIQKLRNFIVIKCTKLVDIFYWFLYIESTFLEEMFHLLLFFLITSYGTRLYSQKIGTYTEHSYNDTLSIVNASLREYILLMADPIEHGNITISSFKEIISSTYWIKIVCFSGSAFQ